MALLFFRKNNTVSTISNKQGPCQLRQTEVNLSENHVDVFVIDDLFKILLKSMIKSWLMEVKLNRRKNLDY